MSNAACKIIKGWVLCQVVWRSGLVKVMLTLARMPANAAARRPTFLSLKQSAWDGVDLEYPEDLHNVHKYYPLAFERVKIRNVVKLLPNLNNKTNYVVHYENFKLYESLG